VALTPGTRLGVYEVTAQIGEGGMGQVYRATDTRLKRQVAIKILPPLLAADPERMARFQREAEVLASLNHPNIAIVHGLEDADGVKALVMELVDGEDLSQRIARGAIPIDEALPFAKQIADALEAAHEQGIIHRDLKPANIKMRADGTLKVLDFGLAKAMEPAAGSSPSASMSPTLSIHATQAGIILGTAAYMSPEQAKGRAVDKRADIWAFGVVLYEMLSGTRGYGAEDVSDTLAAVLTRDVDWTKVPSTTPPRIVALMRDCLVRDPKQRLRDMGEARRVLEQLITGASGSALLGPASSTIAVAAPPTPVWRRALPWAIASLATAVAVGAAWRLVTVKPVASPVTRSRAIFQELMGLVNVSRDGTKVVYNRAGGPQGFHLELRQLDQFEGQALPGTDSGAGAVFSPAGDWIAFSTVDGKIKKTPSNGGPAITLSDGSFNNGATWGDDDTIAYSSATGLMRVPASGGTAEPLTTLDKDKGEVRHLRPQFLPGRPQLLFTVAYGSTDPQFAVLDLKKGGYHPVARGGDNGRYAESGHLLSMRSGTLFALPFDLDHLTPTGPEAPVIESISDTGPGTGTADYAVSQAGLLVYVESRSKGGTTLTWRDRRGVEIPLAGQLSRAWGTGSLSPDGRRVANAIKVEKGADLWVVDMARGTPTRLTFGGTNDNPIWTPDGRALVYSGNKDGNPGLYKVPADGGGQPQLILAATEPVPTSFAPDGKTLVFHEPVPGGRTRITVFPLDARSGTPTPHPLREGSASDADARVSPDGKWVAFVSTESGRPEVYVLPFAGSGAKVQISADGANRPRWSATGRELFFWSSDGGNATLFSSAIQPAPFAASVPQKLFSAFAGSTWGVAPDGQHFLVESVQSGSTLVIVTNWFDELRRRAPVKK
jgi:eukaryotic-like serine/threonine-protein kinase